MSNAPGTGALPSGIVTPLVTFMDKNGEVDREGTTALVDHQVESGIAGLLCVGSTGEIANLNGSQRSSVLRSVVSIADGRVPVWAGVGGLGTADGVEFAKRAEVDGAEALLVLPPLYFDASDAELAVHFRTVAGAVDLPILAYDVPSRTRHKLSPSLVLDLASRGVLAGVKDSSGDVVSARVLCDGAAEFGNFRTYAGVETTMDVMLQLGFDGIMPGLANVLPGPAVGLYDAWRSGDKERISSAQQIYVELSRIFVPSIHGAGHAANAVAAMKIATALVLDRRLPTTLAPFSEPDDGFIEEIRTITSEVLARVEEITSKMTP